MFLDRFIRDAKAPSWRFCAKKQAEIPASPLPVSEETKKCGSFSVTKIEYSVSGGRATRVLITDGKKIALLAERLSLVEANRVYTSFSVPQEKDLTCNVANRSRLVLRSKELGAKLFRLLQTLDGNDGMENAGLLLPDGFSDGELRIAFYSGLTGFAREHLAIFALVEEERDMIKGWHMEHGIGLEITAPDKSCRLRLLADQNKITAIDPLTEDRVALSV